VNSDVNAHQFLGNASYPTRETPTTGINTAPPEILDVEHQNNMIFKDNLINDKTTRKNIVKYIPDDSLLSMGYVSKSRGTLKKTTRDELVRLARDYYFYNPDEAKRFVEFNT